MGQRREKLAGSREDSKAGRGLAVPQGRLEGAGDTGAEMRPWEEWGWEQGKQSGSGDGSGVNAGSCGEGKWGECR